MQQTARPNLSGENDSGTGIIPNSGKKQTRRDHGTQPTQENINAQILDVEHIITVSLSFVFAPSLFGPTKAHSSASTFHETSRRTNEQI